jgi:putative Mn2+ efflux pump MntP
MLLLAIATSIDALAAGVSFAFLSTSLLQCVVIIGVTTFIFSVIGLKIGNVFGNRYKKKAEFVGGAILIIIGLKILVEHFTQNL